MRARRLRWVGHVARMDETRIPKILLFSRLEKKRKPGGLKLRWKDRIQRDFKEIGIDPPTWYEHALDRNNWARISGLRGKAGIQFEILVCEKCGRQCKGKGGLSTHQRYCRRVGVAGATGVGLMENRHGIEGTVVSKEGDVWIQRCDKCGVVLKTAAGVARHKPVCGRATVKKKRMTDKERDDLPTTHACTLCARKFSLGVNLQRHMKQAHPQLSGGMSTSMFEELRPCRGRQHRGGPAS